MIWPPIRYGDATVDESLGTSAPAAPSWLLDDEARCSRYPAGVADPGCKTIGNYHWLGTDDQGRDVVARAALRLPHLGAVRHPADHRQLDHRRRRRRRAGLFRRLDRPHRPALPRHLGLDADALRAADRLERAGARLLGAALHPDRCSAGPRSSASSAPSSCAPAISSMSRPPAPSASPTRRS